MAAMVKQRVRQAKRLSQYDAAEMADLKERVRSLEAAVKNGAAEPAAWPHSIVDDEKEVPGAGWVLPEECRPIYEGDWREYAKSRGLDPDNIVDTNIIGMWRPYLSKKVIKEILRDVGIE